MSTPHADDPFNLQRFVTAQQHVFDKVTAELRSGEKRSHWMWFIFPQVRGLGRSSMAEKFALSSAAEALAYLRHPLLGARLQECTQLVNSIHGRSLNEIFGSPDDWKFRSCMTLFAHVTPSDSEFLEALEKYCRGEPDPKTLEILRAQAPNRS
ncbi:MAG: DUF1810 domain-containing protein [Lysobacterales bacterium]|nr:MAG: DUF1810 domain-containing protein [Xanthomonadales bacterium]